MLKTSGLSKWAVDEKAKKYWSEFFKEYGKSWVREIPRKVKTAFVDGKRVASAGEANLGIVVPVARAVTASAVHLEGLLHTQSGQKFAFQATFDHDGNLTDFDPLAITTA